MFSFEGPTSDEITATLKDEIYWLRRINLLRMWTTCELQGFGKLIMERDFLD